MDFSLHRRVNNGLHSLLPYCVYLENCPGALVDFAGREGKFIEGGVSPPLSSVVITINTKASDAYPSRTIEVETDEQGKYRYANSVTSHYQFA